MGLASSKVTPEAAAAVKGIVEVSYLHLYNSIVYISNLIIFPSTEQHREQSNRCLFEITLSLLYTS